MKKKVISIVLTTALAVTSMGLPAFDVGNIKFFAKNDVFAAENTTKKINSENTAQKEQPVFLMDNTVVLFEAETNLNSALASGDYEISADKGYIVSGKITNSIIVKSGTQCDLTLDSVEMKTAKAAIKVESGALLRLHLTGENTILPSGPFAGIEVCANDTQSDYATLTIDGSGSLNVTGGAWSAAIGATGAYGEPGGSGINGKIVINDGNITAIGGMYSPGIGNAPQRSGAGSIEINGGVINATGGDYSAGIGSAYYSQNGSIKITGGTINAVGGAGTAGIGVGNEVAEDTYTAAIVTGGSINSTFTSNMPVRDKYNNSLHQIKITVPDLAGKAITVDSWTAKADASGSIYPYISNGTTTFAFVCNGKVYYTEAIKDNKKEYSTEILVYEGKPCDCAPPDAAIEIDVEDTINVNKYVGQHSEKLAVNFIKKEGCNYPIHSSIAEFSVSIDGVPSEDLGNYVTLSEGYMIVYFAAAGKKIRINAQLENNGKTYTVSKEITVVGDNAARFDLSKGSIEITKYDSNQMNVKIGDNEPFKISNTTELCIFQAEGAAATSNTIAVYGVDAKLAFENLNVRTITSTGEILTMDNVNLQLTLIGNNVMETAGSTCVVQGLTAGTTITVTDRSTGTWKTTSANGAGIGNIKKLTVNGGTIDASGGNGGAGIGGEYDGNGIEVEINGGHVFAKGSRGLAGGGAGIGGGGNNKSGGKFVINGGYVHAECGQHGESQDGAIKHCRGIGGGGSNPYSQGTIIINGGSVDAEMSSLPRVGGTTSGAVQYALTLNAEGITNAVDFDYYLVDDDTTQRKISTDENGEMHLYLPVGRRWIRLYKGDTVYYKYINVSRTEANQGTCVTDPTPKITEFSIPGQKPDSVNLNNENNTIDVDVPYNIKLDAITPIVKYTGCILEPNIEDYEPLDFSADHTATLTVIGDDKSEREYTITVHPEAAPDPLTADTFDISQGDIIITENYVEFGGTQFEKNEKGYIITGSTTSNTFKIETGTELPPITFENLNITNVRKDINPVNIISAVDVNINVEGECNITSGDTSCMVFDSQSNLIDVNFTGSGSIKMKSESTDGTINIPSDVTLSMTSKPASETPEAAFMAIIEGGVGKNALQGGGKFITDSISNMRIIENNPDSGNVIYPTDGTNRLYQLTVTLQTEDKSSTECKYNNRLYHLGADTEFYLMVPTGYKLDDVEYKGDKYKNTDDSAMGNEALNITLITVKVTKITYNKTSLGYGGGEIIVTVTGNLVENNVTIVADSGIEGDPDISAPVGTGGIATLKLPLNPSYQQSVSYTVYYVIKDQKYDITSDIGTKILTVERNNSVCSIEEFELKGQVGATRYDEAADGTKSFSVNMPYDSKYSDTDGYYEASKITYIGLKVEPNVGDKTKFYEDSRGFIRGYYTVTARDTTEQQYMIKVYNDPKPSITALSFNNNLSSAGGKIMITASGTALVSIHNAIHEGNDKVTIYADGINPVVAEPEVLPNGQYVYKAELTIPPNESSTETKYYYLKAKIGDVEQTGINSQMSVVRVPRQSRNKTGIESFTINGQIKSDIVGNTINVLMPYDADVSLTTPSITLEDSEATYSPQSDQNFDNDVVYTVTADNGVDNEQYTVHVTKEEEPVVQSIEFTNPKYSGAGRIQVKINGEHLENAANGENPYITVNGTLKSGSPIDAEINSAVAILNENNEYVATINVPPNNYDTEREYELYVTVGNKRQTLSGNITLTIPKKEASSKELTDIILTDNQSPITIMDNRVYLYVPYNTDVRNITPQVYHSGVKYITEKEDPQNFNEPVRYTIVAQDGTYNVYEVYVRRDSSAAVERITKNKPQSHNDTTVNVDITGRFIPYIDEGEVKDVLEISAIPRDGGNTVNGTIVYDRNVYGGHASGTLEMPVNNSASDKIYDLKITINGEAQPLGLASTITMPGRKNCAIESFIVNGQRSSEISETENGGSIVFTVPYNMDITEITPIIDISGDRYEPTTAQDFNNKSVDYTVYASGEQRTYTVTAKREGLPSITDVKVTGHPLTFKGSTIDIDVEGVFFYDFKVKAKLEDGTYISDDDITCEMNQPHKASAQIKLPENLDTTKDKVYTLEFYLDGFKEPISYYQPVKVTVPRRKTRAITDFTVSNQVGTTDIQESDIYVRVPYNTDLHSITPQSVSIDGDRYEPTTAQNFDNETKSVVYTVYADDDTAREYTVHILRDGDPAISKLTYISPINFKGGTVTANIEGVFFKSAEVSLVLAGGGEEIPASVTSFEEGKATVSATLPVNNDTENEKIYRYKFKMDGVPVNYIGASAVIVPRRTTRQITEFALPDEVQEGETKIEGTDIYIDVPYNADISSVVPKTFVYDADKIEPAIDLPQDFGSENPVKYTLSSSGDDSVTYTVHVTRVGEDPYLTSFTVDNQAKETEYDGNNIKLTMKAGSNLKEVKPIIVLGSDEFDYKPKDPQDFTNSKKEPVEYTVFNKYGEEIKYYVTIDKRRSGGGGGEYIPSTPTPTPSAEPTVEPTAMPTAEPAKTPSVQPSGKKYISGYEENNTTLFKPDNNITRAEVATIMSILDDTFDEFYMYNPRFNDVNENDWYANYVNFAAERGYILGYDDNTYQPNNMITRAEFSIIISRYINIEPSDSDDLFTDISNFDWCREYINVLTEKGIVKGYNDGTFRPNAPVTRAEAVTIINRATNRNAEQSVINGIECPFSDILAQHWAYNDIIIASCGL